ncbi:MAG: hypothetical protein ABSG59_15315 [Verrucomicrobiota bacterium]|jgi:uncharacterized membrane protein
MTIVLANIQWHPRLAPIWCGALLLGAALWLWLLYRRLLRRAPPGRARWLLAPKLLTLLLLLLALFDPVSAIRRFDLTKSKVLVLTDSSSSMDVADDYRRPRADRARSIIEQWKRSKPAGLSFDELEFDTRIHKPGQIPASGTRGTDMGGCLLALAERNDIASYLGVVLLTDGGDEAIDNPALPKIPLSIVGIGADPATWNDLALADAQAPALVEKDTDFDITADIQARAGHGGGFAQRISNVRVLLERAVAGGWQKASEQTVSLSALRARARLTAKSSETGVLRYRVSVEPVNGELSPLNNWRVVTVNVQKKALRVLYFSRQLGQGFKMLRNELARDPGIAFTALLRTTGDRFTLQGDRLAGDEALAAGFPGTKEGLKPYDVVVIDSFPAADCSPEQMQALIQFVQEGGTLVFLGGDDSFGRGGYAQTPLAAFFPWRLSDAEPPLEQGAFAVHVAPTGLGHPILATVEDVVTRGSVTLDSVNLPGELKPGATALLTVRLGAREVAVVAVQPYGKGKVMGIASNTLWKWATQPEPLRSAYGLFWRQAVRNLSGKTEGGQNFAVRWDKDFYRPGEQAVGEIRLTGAPGGAFRFTASLSTQNTNYPVNVEPMPGEAQAFQVKLRFRERDNYNFRLVAYQGDRPPATYERNFPVAPLVPEGTRLELDEVFLKRLAESAGGAYFPESDAGQFVARLAGTSLRKVSVQESSLAEAGPWFALAFLLVLMLEWMLRRKMNMF